MKKIFCIMLACAFIFTALAGCGAGTDKTASTTAAVTEAPAATTQAAATDKPAEEITLVTSRWAGPNADDQAEILKEFTKETGIQVKQDAIDYGQLHQKQVLNMSSATGEYDLIYAQEIWVPEYVNAGYLKPLDEYAANKELAGPDFSLDNYIQAFLKIDTMNGKLYAIPTFAQADVFAYNKDMLKEIGIEPHDNWTWDEVLSASEKFKAKGTGIALPFKQGLAIAEVFLTFARSNGGDYFNSEGKLDLAKPENIEAAEYIKKLSANSLKGSTGWHYDEVNKAVQFGQAPMGITISGLCNALEDPANSKVSGKIGYAPLPYKKDPKGLISLWSWVIPNSSKHPEEAFKLLAWLTSAKIEKAQSLKNGQISAQQSLFNDSELVQKSPWLPAMKTIFDNGSTAPLDSNASKLSEGVSVALSAIVTGKEDPKAVLEKAQNDLKSLYP